MKIRRYGKKRRCIRVTMDNQTNQGNNIKPKAKHSCHRFLKVKTFRRFDNFIHKGKCNQSVISLFNKLENEIQMFNC